MNFLSVWGPAIICAITSVFTAGLLVEKQRYHGKMLEKHDDRLDGHDIVLSAHRTILDRRESWHDGFDAGRNQKHNANQSTVHPGK